MTMYIFSPTLDEFIFPQYLLIYSHTAFYKIQKINKKIKGKRPIKNVKFCF